MNDYSIVKLTDAATEPISIDQAKAHLRVDPSANDDAYITGLITAARTAVELEIGRPIGSQKFELGLRCWPNMVRFPFPPLIDVRRIAYTVYEGAEVVLLDKDSNPTIDLAPMVRVDTSGDPGELWLRPTEVWPSSLLESGFPVRIRYTAGITALPKPLVQAILMLLGTWYENRESVLLGRNNQGYELPMSVQWLCQKFAFEEMG